MPVPKVIPTKILAQYEQEEETMKRIRGGGEGEASLNSLSASKRAKAEGLERKYLSVKEKEEPTYKKDPHRQEANVIPWGPSVEIQPKKQKIIEKNPYE